MKQASRQASRQASKPRGCAFKDEASLEAGFKAGLEAGLEAGFQGLKDIFSMKQALRPYQMQATKTNPCRQKSRESNLLHHGPQNKIQKTSRNREAIKGPRLYKQQVGTDREKKACVKPTLMLMLERRKSACKTSAVSNKILRWLTPLLGPNLDPKTGPKRRPMRRN